jgi:hypothetical protein
MTQGSETTDRTDALKRRGLIAAGAALITGGLAKVLTKPAAAGHSGSDPTVCHLGVSNEATAITSISRTPGAVPTTAPPATAFVGISPETGVYGECTGSFGSGVRGVGSTSGVGVHASSVDNEAVHAFSARAYGVYAGSGLTYGLYATSNAGIAGRFNGNVLIEGNQEVQGNQTVTGTKSAVVPHPDGWHRRLYALESPDSWFEDFGEGRLQAGQAEVAIDPDFAALVRGDTYQIFLTPYGNCRGLYVSERGPAGFTVRELQDGTSSVAFGYRLAAKRQDLEAPRLERVQLPAAGPAGPA